MMETQKFGTHSASPYQLTDLNPGVNDRPVRTGYQPQSFQLQSKPPKILQKDCRSIPPPADLPPEPVIFQPRDEQQGSGNVKTRNRRGGSKSQLPQMVRLRQPSDSPMITGKFDALLKEFGNLGCSQMCSRHYPNRSLQMRIVTDYSMHLQLQQSLGICKPYNNSQ